MSKKVVVGMSGGVDSSVAAFLLKKQGYDVIGVTMQIWQDEENVQVEENGGCCGLSAVDDARRVAQMLDIPYYVMNFKKEFKENVMDYFVGEYLCGRTPNPCIACNRFVKWESLLQRSLSLYRRAELSRWFPSLYASGNSLLPSFQRERRKADGDRGLSCFAGHRAEIPAFLPLQLRDG